MVVRPIVNKEEDCCHEILVIELRCSDEWASDHSRQQFGGRCAAILWLDAAWGNRLTEMDQAPPVTRGTDPGAIELRL
jgi:hypothetical protein